MQQQLSQKLNTAGIYGPDSDQCLQFEKSLTRYFEKEYQRYLNKPVTLQDAGISTDTGPMMQVTDELMQQHYDERIALFDAFLDTRYFAYTMAYYGDNADQDISLEQAQRNKFELIAQRAGITGNEKILNIGCGFGSLETFLLETYPDLHITGVTPSETQIQYLRERMQDNNHPLSNGFELLPGTIQALSIDTIGKSQYDLVITIGVFEQLLNMREMLSLIARLLKPGGRTFHHFITSQTVIPQLLDPQATLIKKYFPGGRIWPHDEFARHTEHLDITNTWFVNGKNYWRTLDEWHKRFWSNVPMLYQNDFDTAELKHWNEYFSLCKAMFAPMDGEFYGNSQYLFTLK